MADSLITLNDVVKIYRRDETEVPVLGGITLSINRGERLSIMGRSGSGKSTLLNIIGGLDVPTSGTYHFAGQDVGQLSDEQISKLRNRTFGFVFQAFHLLKGVSVIENVELPLEYSDIPTSEHRARAAQLLALVGLEHRASHRPRELSGGERQRVVIARALATRPEVLLADEPTGSLDSEAQHAILDLFAHVQSTLGTTLIVVTHDQTVATGLGGRLVHLADGKLES